MSKPSFTTPILFLIYNRPEYTRRVFEEIKKIQPRYLYIAADGPQPNNQHDVVLCQESRKIIDQIDWPCSVQTLLRDSNLGCKKGVSSAINWFFEHVEEGIILEDDCMPAQGFFSFCYSLLEKYRHEPKVMMIAGTNFVSGMAISESYFFSECYLIWGWATWRRAWKLYDVTMNQSAVEEDREMLTRAYGIEPRMVRHMEYLFSLMRENKLDTWDIQWMHTCLKYLGMVIVPRQNLISNIGLVGLHTKGREPLHELPQGSFTVDNLKHPATMVINKTYNQTLYDKAAPVRWKVLIRALVRKSKKLLHF